MSLSDKINEALKDAMKSKNTVALESLRAIKSSLLLAQTESGAKKQLSEEEEIKILQRLVKQRKESAKIYEEQGREDLAQSEMEQVEIIEKFLPEQLTQEEIETIIDEIIPAEAPPVEETPTAEPVVEPPVVEPETEPVEPVTEPQTATEKVVTETAERQVETTEQMTDALTEQIDMLEMAAPKLSGAELIARARTEIGSLQNTLDNNSRALSETPKKRRISASTKEYAAAAYMRAWEMKVERIGNMNYPQEAKDKGINGSLMLSVDIQPDGSVPPDGIVISRSSGHQILDDAAVRIVRLAAPYAAIPEDVLNGSDMLTIIRTWKFASLRGMSAR